MHNQDVNVQLILANQTNISQVNNNISHRIQNEKEKKISNVVTFNWNLIFPN